MIEDVLTGTRYDRKFRKARPSAVEWPMEQSTLQHWATLRKLFELTAEGRVKERIEIVEESIRNAELLYGRLLRHDVRFDPLTNATHLKDWADAIKTFRDGVRI